MKLQLRSPSLGAFHHLQAWCARVAPNQAACLDLSHANYNRTSPALCHGSLHPLHHRFPESFSSPQPH
jgi:hypothetical protein